MPRQRLIISNMPLRGGLATAGRRGTIAENQLWRTQNVGIGLDGVMTKRPGLEQWGQVLKQPSTDADLLFYEPFFNFDAWSSTEASTSIETQVTQGRFTISVAADGGGAATNIYERTPQGSESDSAGDDWSVRFRLRTSNMPSDGDFVISARAQSGNDTYAFQFTDDGVYYYDGAWQSMYAVDLDDGRVRTVEIRFDADGNATLYLDETLVATTAVSSMTAYTAISGTGWFSVRVPTSATLSDQYTIYISDLMFAATVSSPFTAQRVGAGTDFKKITGGAGVRRYLLVATPTHVYVDYGLTKNWVPLLALSGTNVTFAEYIGDLIIFDADDAFDAYVYRWDDSELPTLLGDAPDVRFGTSHRTRLFAAGDKTYPLRLYYTASRQPNVWFAPDTDEDGQEQFDEVLEAGYIEIEGKRGDEITGVYGEYYGSCIVTTNRGTWRITGSSPAAFTVENVTQDTGAAAQAAIARIGNDLWMAGRQGITTLRTAQEFGDMRSQLPSAPVADMWSPVPNSTLKVDQDQLYKASMAWDTTQGLLYFAFAQLGSSEVNRLYVFSTASGQWHGPWTGDTVFVTSVEVSSPVMQLVMHGTDTGYVGVTDVTNKTDFGTNYTTRFELPALSGRSLDPQLTHQMKTWRTLRLFIQPRGDWNLSISWDVDDETAQTRTENQNAYNLPVLSDDFRLDEPADGLLQADSLLGVIEIPLEVRGRYLSIEIETEDTEDSEDIILQGYEVELLPDGPDQETE